MLLVARGDELGDAVRDCEQAGGRAVALAVDVTEADAAERIIGAAESELGPVDVLINNAGTARWRSLDEVPDADWQAAWDLNVMAPMRLMRAAIPGMRERGWGRIVNVASTSGKRPSAMMPEYSVAKAAQLCSRACSPTSTPGRACSSTPSRPARPSRTSGWARTGFSTNPARLAATARARRPSKRPARSADRPPRRARRDRGRDRIPLLRARVVRRRRGLERRRRHGAGDHLSQAASSLADSLLSLNEAAAMDAAGRGRRRARADLRMAGGPGPDLHGAAARPPPARRRNLVPRRPQRGRPELPRDGTPGGGRGDRARPRPGRRRGRVA